MVDLRYVFEKDLLNGPKKGVCVYIPTADGGFVQICDTDVKKVLEQVELLKQINSKKQILKLRDQSQF